MFDLTTNKGKLLDAALKLAADKKWTDVTLREIAHRADVSMDDLKKEISSKAHIFGLFTSAVDAAVLAKVGEPDLSQSSRDNLFETMMNRFDVMQPYKAGIKSMLSGSTADPRLAQRLLSSQGWMLEAAGISSYGPLGAVKTVGLASVYMQATRIWLNDDDPGMARTMAALDRRLKRGERSMQALDDGVRSLGRFASTLRCRKRKSEDTGAGSTADSATENVVDDGTNGMEPAMP